MEKTKRFFFYPSLVTCHPFTGFWSSGPYCSSFRYSVFRPIPSVFEARVLSPPRVVQGRFDRLALDFVHCGGQIDFNSDGPPLTRRVNTINSDTPFLPRPPISIWPPANPQTSICRPEAMITANSMAFSSSLTFPGQSYEVNAWSACLDIPPTNRPVFCLKCSRK